MKVILMTLSDILPTVINNILSSELEYSAIVVDEIEPAKKFMTASGRSADIVHAFVNLKECVENYQYDCVICFSDDRLCWHISEAFKYHGVLKNKLVHLYFAFSVNCPFILERNIRYFREHADEFDMISVGASRIAVGIDETQFENHKLFNFGRSAQDLYYDYKVARYILEPPPYASSYKYQIHSHRTRTLDISQRYFKIVCKQLETCPICYRTQRPA